MTDLSSGGNFYFLLKTENIQPLVDTIDEFSKQIQNNQLTINKITEQIDSGFRLPDSTNVENNEDAGDPLRYLLNQKYQLDSIDPTDSKVYHSNAKIDLLIKDNIKLARLKQQKNLENQELVNVIHDYESLIIEQILPSLRNDLTGMEQPNFIDYKYSLVNKIYARYSMNLHYLAKLIDLFNELFEFLQQYDKFYYQLLNQLEVLSNLKHNIVNVKLPLIKKNINKLQQNPNS